MRELATLAGTEDLDGIWRWYRQEYPKCMALVPTRRRHTFAQGVVEGYHETGLDP